MDSRGAGLGRQIVVLNGGSSSIKFSIYTALQVDDPAAEPRCLLDGELSGIGRDKATLKVGSKETEVDARELSAGIHSVLQAITENASAPPVAVGYRVVHPGPHLHGHQRVTLHVLNELDKAADFAPLHDPEALQLIRATMERWPEIAHFVCFDTAFHETMPEEATTYPLPQSYRDSGLRRYGFHGLSCESIVRQMCARGELPKRMVIAHLGSGCSVTAVLDGRSIDTTMGLTPTGGVLMGTRSGDLDPGLVLYLLREQTGTAERAACAVEQILNRDSGIAALSEMPNDVQAVRKAASSGNDKARLALKVFTRSITKAIGSFCWLLGGLDAIVFAGGIGEHDPQTREEILVGLTEVGVVAGPARAQAGPDGVQIISTVDSKTQIFIVPAQEDLMIAFHVARMLQAGN